MTEQWAIIALTGVVAWVAYELHQLRDEIKACVHKDDCKTDMGEHCDQLKDLWGRVQENSAEITAIKTRVDMFHNQQ